MDLFLSAQSVGVLAGIAASCMVAGGVLAQQRARKRASQLQKRLAEPTPVEALSAGKRVLVAGVLQVDGSCCPRLEDAAPVAATTYEQPKRQRLMRRSTISWCDRALRLRVQVGKVSIALEGPVRVVVGSDEHYPGCTLDSLRGRVTERVYDSEMLASEDPCDAPRHGVFRSVCAGDKVVVAGLVERVADVDGPVSYRVGGGGWRLRPDETGALRLWNRRRPKIGGPLGHIRAYAAAMVGVLTAVMLAWFACSIG